MANDVRITINGIVADVYDSRTVPLQLDFQIEDVSDFSKRKGSGSSTTYRLPATQGNANIYGVVGRVSPQPTDSIKGLLPTVIEVGGVPILTGQSRLIRVVTVSDYTGRRALEYEIAFIAENADWFSLMDGLTLQDIDWSDLDHAFTSANIIAGFSADGSVDAYGYTLIKWKNWANVNYIGYQETTPFLFANAIVERAFNLVGYTVDSTFLTAEPFVNCMSPIPLRNYSGNFFIEKTNLLATKTTSTSVTTPPFTYTIIYDDEVTPPNSDIGANYDPLTGIYTVPFDASYRLKASVQVNNIVGVGSTFGFVFLKNGVTLIPPAGLFFTIVNGDTLYVDQTVDLVTGDTIEVVISASAGVTSYDYDGGTFEVECQAIDWALNGTSVFFDYLVPDWSLKDYIKGLTEMFNLYIYADSAAKTVRIEPRNTFIDGTRDISQQIDLGKNGSIQFVPSQKNIQYQYRPDGKDATVEAINDGRVLPTLSGRYTISDVTATGEKKIQNSFFAPTLSIRDSTIAGFAGNDTPPLIPIIWGEDFGQIKTGVTTDYVFAPRILYHAGLIATGAGSAPSPEGSISINSASTVTRSAYPKSFMVDYDNSTRPSLAYGQEVSAFGIEINGLIRTFHLNQLATINNGVQRMEWWGAKITDIIQEQFRELIIINGDRYVLQKIEAYNPTQQETTKIILLEDVCSTQNDVDAIETTTQQNVING